MVIDLLKCVECSSFIHMRTNIEIRDELMGQAQGLGGFKTKKETVEAALKLFIQVFNRRKVRELRGKLKWDGNLEQMRLDK